MAGDDIDKDKQVDKSLETLKEQGRVPADGKGEGRPHLVSIVHQNGCCKVEPPVLHANPGDTIHWKVDGSADEGGQLFFPNEGLFGKQHERIPRGGSGEAQMQQNVAMGRYPYAVYCKAHNCFAVGNSDPRVDYP